jgi:hypothetical protein
MARNHGAAYVNPKREAQARSIAREGNFLPSHRLRFVLRIDAVNSVKAPHPQKNRGTAQLAQQLQITQFNVRFNEVAPNAESRT